MSRKGTSPSSAVTKHDSMFELREVFHQMCQPMTTLLWMLELGLLQETDPLKQRSLKDALTECQRLTDGIHAAQDILAREVAARTPNKTIEPS